MLIIIDAYNYMKVTSGDKHISERAEREFMRLFKKYLRFRGNQLMVVFDAGPTLFESDTTDGAVHVVYSGQMQTADDSIIKYIRSHMGQDILLVTSDRELRDIAKRCNVVSISSPDFHKIFMEVLDQYDENEARVARDAIKTTDGSNSDLDQLMELGSRNIVSQKKNEVPSAPRYVRNSKKVSKNDKWVMRKINKI